MALACLISPDVYNFSELLEQPVLLGLGNSDNVWLYELLRTFDKGDIQLFK